MSLDEIYKLYIISDDTYLKSKLLNTIIIKLDPYIDSVARRYHNKCAYHAIEDWKQIVTIGVLSGIKHTRDNASMKSSIMYHIQKEGSDAIRYIKADKRNYDNEILESDITYCLELPNFDIYNNKSYEDDWVTTIDLKHSISNLPYKNKILVNQLLVGSTWDEICDNLKISKSTFYNLKEKTFNLLRQKLKGYECVV